LRGDRRRSGVAEGHVAPGREGLGVDGGDGQLQALAVEADVEGRRGGGERDARVDETGTRDGGQRRPEGGGRHGAGGRGGERAGEGDRRGGHRRRGRGRRDGLALPRRRAPADGRRN